MNIKKIKNIDVLLVEYRWILTFNLTDLIKNLEEMILGLFVTKMVWLWFQVIGGNLEGNRCVASTNTRVCKYNFGGIKLFSRGSSMGPFNKLYCLAGNEEGLITNDAILGTCMEPRSQMCI